VKITLLGEKAFERLTPIIHEQYPDIILNTNEPLTDKLIDATDLFISYGYRHIITADQLKKMKRAPVNLHISLLPWNRGADPNFWSWLDETPKGVSIHLIDEGVDTGPLIAQSESFFLVGKPWTLKNTYEGLEDSIENLFEKYWPKIRMGDCVVKEQISTGSVHKKQDLEKYRDRLSVKGFDTPVSEVRSWRTS
jgi:methionyl-tRNA formyltransferase